MGGIQAKPGERIDLWAPKREQDMTELIKDKPNDKFANQRELHRYYIGYQKENKVIDLLKCYTCKHESHHIVDHDYYEKTEHIIYDCPYTRFKCKICYEYFGRKELEKHLDEQCSI